MRITIKKLLVANRGEIAMRIMRTAKAMNIKTVAVYSEADRIAPHVQYADAAVFIGAGPASQSYLLIDTIIDACKLLNVDAVHPGYGFLSENAEFAEKVSNAGIEFIGPSASSIKIMGNKLSAKATVKKYDIPMIPSTDNAINNVDEAKISAKSIGYPVLIKASAGGGGKGMRVVESESELEDQMKIAINEASSAFGDSSVFIEKYITSNKHIEVQIIGDKHGNYVHLFERECSIQRRHQKVIEEAPSMVIDNTIREQLGQAAIKVAQSCGYYGAGTVEFIFHEGEFYFLEMNTRLQVEHPVTEQITGIDLVQEQINIASGNPLSFNQRDISISGHAIEVRVYAEDPENDFLPDIGRLHVYRKPQGRGIRVDDGVDEGNEISIYYDSMLSKLITYGNDREEARKRMIQAIDEYAIIGVKTTLEFCKFTLQHPTFINGEFDTKFVEKYYHPKDTTEEDETIEKLAVAVSAHILLDTTTNIKTAKTKQTLSKWKLRSK